MQHRRPDLWHQLDYLAAQVAALDNLVARKDLGRFLAHARNLAQDLDRELVRCRNRGRYTADYDNIEREFQQQLAVVSRWLTWALLKF